MQRRLTTAEAVLKILDTVQHPGHRARRCRHYFVVLSAFTTHFSPNQTELRMEFTAHTAFYIELFYYPQIEVSLVQVRMILGIVSSIAEKHKIKLKCRSISRRWNVKVYDDDKCNIVLVHRN